MIPFDPEARGARLVREKLKTIVVTSKEPMRLAEAFLQHRYQIDGMPTLVRWARAWWRFDAVRFVEFDDEALRAQIAQFLDCAVIDHVNEEGEVVRKRLTSKNRTIAEVMTHLLAVVPTIEEEAPSWTVRKEDDLAADLLLPCKNGLLNLKTHELMLSTPRLFTTSCIGARWQPDVPRPNAWFAFLESLWGDDKESIATLQQIFGYLLTTDTSFHKLFAIIGPKRSGKSTIARILRALLGEDSVVNPTLSSLERPFGLAPLVGTKLAIIGDARLGGRADQAQIVERFLSISGEDPLSIDRKNRDPINVRLHTRVLLIANELPRLYDTSGALASRFVILQTNRSFLGEEDVALEAKLLAELPGIFAWAIDGREDLLERGRFNTPAASEQAMADMEIMSSPMKAFVADCLFLDVEAEVSSEALWTKWKEWCKEGDRFACSKEQFFRDLRTIAPDLRQAQSRRPDGKRTRVYQGVRLV